MDCQYANSCTPGHTLPMTGFELFALVGVAVVLIAAGLLMRFSRGDASDA